MGAEVCVDPAALRAVAPRFVELADAVESAQRNLSSALAAEGECWGADESGQSFAQSYVGDVAPTVDTVAKLAQVLTSMRDRMVHTADNYDDTDTQFGGALDGSM
ncbi:WXG100 family type VII secretion target [Aldersonia sp. NBC_00410]|uniref:WXG100 family type VII secretion target n=1 Tax=Aldersonia sp. NBC_00410 TaxID=2975954 RepID=UPI002250E616|nr:WXG100 family type VII secretion target [Aldersonia sp. NBC_00410]MCX5044463.1 WXG100 family type VII secretion target [Aldersonia sp. NBC_00410]